MQASRNGSRKLVSVRFVDPDRCLASWGVVPHRPPRGSTEVRRNLDEYEVAVTGTGGRLVFLAGSPVLACSVLDGSF
jgi:hypothetical protein